MNRAFIVLCVAIIISQQPMKSPKGTRAAEGKSSQIADQAKARKNDDKPTIQTAPTPAPPAVSADSKPEPVCHSSHASKSDDDEKIQRQLALFTGLLVLVGFLQVAALVWQAFLFWRQAGIMREHKTSLEQLAKSAIDNAESARKNSDFSKANAEAMEKSVGVFEKQAVLMKEQIIDAKESGAKATAIAQATADAALLNAQVVINAERPWVIPKIRKTVKWIDSFELNEEGKPRPVKRRVVYFAFSVINKGRTPAQVFAIRGRPRFTDKGIHGGLEDPPDYGPELVFMQTRILPPGQRWDYSDIDLEFTDCGEDIRKGLESFQLHRIFKGVVLYRDMLRPSEVHESRFCYTYFWLQENYLPSGPPDHTKYT